MTRMPVQMLKERSNGAVNSSTIHSYVQKCYRKEESSEDEDVIEECEESTYHKSARGKYDPIDDTTPRKRVEEGIIDDEELLRIVEESERQQLDMFDFITQQEDGDEFFDVKEKTSRTAENENNKAPEAERVVGTKGERMINRKRDSLS